MRKERYIDLIGCARCHGDGHEGLKFELLDHPIPLLGPDGQEYEGTYWATCPTNGQPIIMALKDREEPAARETPGNPTDKLIGRLIRARRRRTGVKLSENEVRLVLGELDL